ncbi:hypothetical protein B0T26DRAFT_517581 [Lasiosphaeria miniovina]|uniref:Uncharacterized protein n=1 Tax=Lasiosphaeria miniovina TaxID=1954250 RepID=A0AA39ZUD1_9PEZI|nr:uncharacterized protein B0T26DRAFT_517581 [Lasiosphaeria miniovina]KAK0703904.1 hypothetical protein B0T26DRAFT_517581 [Lasiosphaeria miniovina]
MLRQYYIGRREMMDHWGIIHNGSNMSQHQVARIQLEEIASTRRFAALHTRLVFEGTRHGMFGLPHGRLVENFDSKYNAEFMAALPPYERPGHNSDQLYEAFRCLMTWEVYVPTLEQEASWLGFWDTAYSKMPSNNNRDEILRIVSLGVAWHDGGNCGTQNLP